MTDRQTDGQTHGENGGRHNKTAPLRAVSEHIYEKDDGPYRGFGYSSLFSDPLDLATWNHTELL